MPSAIILKKDVRLDVPSIAQYFAQALDVNIQDARLIIRKARGIFQEFQEEGRSVAIAQALNKIGIETEVIPQAEIPKAPTMRRVFSGRVDKAGLDLTYHPRRVALRIPWSEIHYVSIGVIATPKYDEFVTSRGFGSLTPMWSTLAHRELGLTATEEMAVKERAHHRPKMDKRALESLYSEHTEGYTDLWTVGSPYRYRISRRDFDYTSLGKRVMRRSWDNFRILMNEVHASTPKALYTKMSKDYLVGAEFFEIIFDNNEEFDRYWRWFLHQAAGANPRPGVIAPKATNDLLGPTVQPVDEVESLD